MSTIIINPCKVCGKNAFIGQYFTSGYGRGYPAKEPDPQHGKYYVCCYSRTCNRQSAYADTKEQAIINWNNENPVRTELGCRIRKAFISERSE
jgi:hypothetical protein